MSNDLKVAPITSGRSVDEETVSLLRELLEKAEAGELVSLTYVDQYHDGRIGDGWSGRPSEKMIAHLESLKWRYLADAHGLVMAADEPDE